MTAPRDTVVRRALRAFMLGFGPLKRRSDRVQAIGRLLVVASVLVAPLAGLAASIATSDHLRSVAATEAAERVATRAVVLEDAADVVRSGSVVAGDAGTTAVPVRAEWWAPGGTTREGIVLVEPHTPAGTPVEVWVDAEGNRANPPLDPAGIPTAAVTMGGLPLLGLPLVAWTLYFVLTSWLDERRERSWAAEWAAVGPEWRSRLL